MKFHFSSDILTLDNIFLTVIVVVSLSWIWGNITAMEKNYALQKKLELKRREALISEISYKTLEYEQKYLKSSEYQEIAARQKLGLANEGEHLLILSKYPEEVEEDRQEKPKTSNFTQWMNFLFGGNAQKVENS